MKVFKRLVALFTAFLIILTVSGCSSDYMDAYIYFELENKPSTLDPQLVSTRDESVIVRSIFDTLLRYDDEGKIICSAAESYDKKGLTYSFKISEDAHWTNGDKLTAYDFEFGFKRALDPKTAAPAVATLDCVEAARAVSEDELLITLRYDDPDFFNTLTTPIAMPCNEKFFNSCKGKYGLELDSVLACGSYYIRKWPTEGNFLIRLAKNLEYKGYFEARSMRVYFTCDERENGEMLAENDTDLAFIGVDEVTKAEENGLVLSATEDTCYLLFLSPALNTDIRSALFKSVKFDKTIADRFTGASVAKAIAPACLKNDLEAFAAEYPYDIASATGLYSNAVLDDENLSLKGNILKCYGDPAALETAKSVVSHWQQNLGAFMNIEETSSLSSLRATYEADSYTAIIMPVRAEFYHTASYISQFKSNAADITSLQSELGDNALCYPLLCQSRYTAATEVITNFGSIISGHFPDVALAIKEE